MVAAVVAAAAVAVIDMNRQPRLLMQFHITGQCNLQCKHCYRAEGNIQPLSYDDVVTVIEQYKSLLQRYNQLHFGEPRKGHINITGGEPMIRDDIREILRYLGDNAAYFSYGVLSNGSFIDESMIKLLSDTNVSFVQLSIDGDRATHDNLRAIGDYDRTFAVAEKLEKNDIRTYISFTANRQNMNQLPLVAKECRKRYITKLWSDRMVPIGNGEEMADLAITSQDLSDYLCALRRAQGNTITSFMFPKTKVTMNRALQFFDSTGERYSCSAGDSLITVDEFGNIMPCRRMPIKCGTVFESTLEEIYFEHPTFELLRRRYIPRECLICIYREDCRGGAKCQSFAAYQSFYRADPACPLQTDK